MNRFGAQRRKLRTRNGAQRSDGLLLGAIGKVEADALEYTPRICTGRSPSLRCAPFRVRKLAPNHRIRAVLVAAVLLVLFGAYTARLTVSTPGCFLDEDAIGLSAYCISRSGADENGVRWPLYFLQFKDTVSQTIVNPTYIYGLAAFFRIETPSTYHARLFSALLGFGAALLLGLLATRLTGRRAIGIVIALVALWTPWLYEVSRLIFEVAMYPMALVLYLLALEAARHRERWTLGDCIRLALGLGLLTYTYSIGRLLAPLLGLGLCCFATRARRSQVAITWCCYAVTLVPYVIYAHAHPGQLTTRFYRLSYIAPGDSLASIVPRFAAQYLDNWSLHRLLFEGDLNTRHHMATVGSFLAAPLLLAGGGLLLIVLRHRRDPWWRYVVLATMISVVPVSLTRFNGHALHLICFPVLLILLSVPALQWLLEPKAAIRRLDFVGRRAALYTLLLAATAQAALYQVQFHREGPLRGYEFNENFAPVFQAAVARPARPIYMIDGLFPPVFVYGYWYAINAGLAPTDFVHLRPGLSAPPGATVLSTEDTCSNCKVVERLAPWMTYVQQ